MIIINYYDSDLNNLECLQGFHRIPMDGKHDQNANQSVEKTSEPIINPGCKPRLVLTWRIFPGGHNLFDFEKKHRIPHHSTQLQYSRISLIEAHIRSHSSNNTIEVSGHFFFGCRDWPICPSIYLSISISTDMTITGVAHSATGCHCCGEKL